MIKVKITRGLKTWSIIFVLVDYQQPCEPDVCVFPVRAVFSLAFLLLTFFSASLPPLFRFFAVDLDIVCFTLSSCVSLWVLAVSSVSVSAATRLAHDMYLDAYVRWSQLLIFVWGTVSDLFQLLCILSSVFSDFFSWGNILLQSYWSLSCDHGLHCRDEFMWEQARNNISHAWTRCIPIEGILDGSHSARCPGCTGYPLLRVVPEYRTPNQPSKFDGHMGHPRPLIMSQRRYRSVADL